MSQYNGHIERTPGVCGGRPRIAGHRIRVQDVVVWYTQIGQSPEQIADSYRQITLAHVYAALAYYFDHRNEIDSQIREDEAFVTQLRAETGPGPLERLQSNRPGGDPISS